MRAPGSLSSVHAKMSALEREAGKQIQAILQFRAVLQNANRLLWPDMFQLELVQAARLLHFDLRPKLHRKATVAIAERFEYYADILVKILACWHQRNKLLTIKLGLTLDDIPTTARIGQDERREIFEAKAKTLPTLEGCEVNLLTALAFKSYFTACIAFKMTAEEHGPSSQAEKQIFECLVSIKDHVNTVTTSAEKLPNNAAAPWSRLSQIQAANLSSTKISNVVESKRGPAKKKGSQALQKVRRMFSMSSLKRSEQDLSEKDSSRNLRDGLKRMSKFISQQCLSMDHGGPSSAPVQSSPLPSLSVLHPASLVELEEKQLQTRIAFLRASGHDRRRDGRMELNDIGQEYQHQSQNHAASQDRARSPCAKQKKGNSDSVAGFDVDDTAAFRTQAWQERDNHTSTPEPRFTVHSNRRRGLNHSNQFSSSSGDELKALERDIRKDCTTASPREPSHIVDSETEKVWWRDQAFERLEGRSSQMEEQVAEQTAKGGQRVVAAGREGGEFTGEQLDAWKAEATALALSVSEETGPCDMGSDFGAEEGGSRFDFAAFEGRACL